MSSSLLGTGHYLCRGGGGGGGGGGEREKRRGGQVYYTLARGGATLFYKEVIKKFRGGRVFICQGGRNS